jgi:hypothetical protein
MDSRQQAGPPAGQAADRGRRADAGGAETWASIVEALRSTLSRQQFETWFRAKRPGSNATGRNG